MVQAKFFETIDFDIMKLLKQKIFNEFLLKCSHLKVIKFDIINKLQFICDMI